MYILQSHVESVMIKLTLHKIWQITVFLWPIFSRTKIEPTILSLYSGNKGERKSVLGIF